jgi:metallophosphoesterase (TIGR03767 family)
VRPTGQESLCLVRVHQRFTLTKESIVPQISRRSLLLAGAGGLALASIASVGTASTLDRALATTGSRALTTAGTTLEQAAAVSRLIGYSRLTAGPGFPLVVREELAKATVGRDSRRTAVASIVQFTDLHLIDAQSPMRFEYMVDQDPSAFRPHEALGTHAASKLVERVNQIAVGPFGGRPFDCVVSTGDNSDNGETIEMDWFLSVMNGGSIVANTGSASGWEGVQNTGDSLYYNPELDVRDRYKKAGFPQLANYFESVMREHVSQGLRTPWYSVFGNHDDSIGGTVPMGWTALEDAYTGGTKFTGFRDDLSNLALTAVFLGVHPIELSSTASLRKRWQVTQDERRKPFTPVEFMNAHLATDQVGPGPVGHGFEAAAAFAGRAYYSFPISPGVTGIALDSTNRAGFTHGSLGTAQLRWLEATLTAGSGRYFDGTGHRVTHRVDDEYFVLFSHHTTGTMDNPLPDPAVPLEKRHLGPEVVELVHRFPNVLAWVNGHTHSNSINPRPGATPTQGFWEINTASHIEFPQQARIVEVCDNRDGTLSLFTTLIESAAPYEVSYSDRSPEGLASLYREFSANDLYYKASHEGGPLDHNTELMLVDPLA